MIKFVDECPKLLKESKAVREARERAIAIGSVTPYAFPSDNHLLGPIESEATNG